MSLLIATFQETKEITEKAGMKEKAKVYAALAA